MSVQFLKLRRLARCKYIWWVLPVFLLLTAQLATIQHAIAHTHHAAGELCAGFQAFEHNAASLAVVSLFSLIGFLQETVDAREIAASIEKSFPQPIRGPPALSLI